MFDMSFAELLLIGVVALLVLGPERLPGAVRTVSLWLGRLRRSFNEVRREIEREVGADEIRQQLHNESVMASLREGEQKLRSSVERAGEEAKDLETKLLSDAKADQTPADDLPPSLDSQSDTEKKDPTP